MRRCEQQPGHSIQTPNRQASAAALGRKARGQKPQASTSLQTIPVVWQAGAERKPHSCESTWERGHLGDTIKGG